MKSKPTVARESRLSADEIRRLLEPMNLRSVAVGAGLHHNTVCRFMRDEHVTREATLVALSRYLREWAGAVQ